MTGFIRYTMKEPLLGTNVVREGAGGGSARGSIINSLEGSDRLSDLHGSHCLFNHALFRDQFIQRYIEGLYGNLANKAGFE